NSEARSDSEASSDSSEASEGDSKSITVLARGEEVPKEEEKQGPILDLARIIIAQKSDLTISRIRDLVESERGMSTDQIAGESVEFKILYQLRLQLRLDTDLLVLKDVDEEVGLRIVVPASLVEEVIRLFHEGPGVAHPGSKKTRQKVSRSYYWPRMKRDIDLFVLVCEVCDKFRAINKIPHSRLNPIAVGNKFELVAMDVMGGKDTLLTTPSGNRCILTIVDLFTKYGVAVPMPDQTAETVSRTFQSQWMLRFGAPRRLLTDQGRNFESRLIANLCTIWRIDKVRTTSYHPAGNGACERLNRTIKNNLQRLMNESRLEEWDQFLPDAVFAYNTSVHSSTSFTPQYLMFGSEARMPGELLVGLPELLETPASLAYRQYKELESAFESTRVSLRTVQRRSKDYYDLGSVERIFKIGDRVR
ncbi:MAG: DDE-type integrase/transposase/recombinase, partial [Nitrospirota bacterium]